MKHNNFIPVLIFSLLFTLGSCNSSDDLLDTFVNESEQSYLSSLQVKDLNFNTETVEITKHIKFENDSFYLDITLEEAIRHNISKDIYYKCNDRLEVHNKEVKEIIDRGGKYTFTNQFAEINLQKINIDELRTKTLTPPFMGYGGYLTYPGNNDISLLFPDDTIFRGFSFWFNSEVVYKNGSPGVAIIWYTYRVDGRDKNGMLCSDGGSAVGMMGVAGRNIPFQGEIGEDARPQYIVFKAEMEFESETLLLKMASCELHATNAI